MPRTGGIYSEPAGTKATPNTTIQSSPYNSFVDDLVQDANAARPITAGGTGSTTASGARTNLALVPGTNIQAYDALLQSIAGLTTSANQIIYTTATDTAAVSTITTFGRSLIDDADAAAGRTTLGVVIGTNVQAYDAGLQSIAGLTTAADRMIYTTALDTYAVTTLTAFGRSLVDDANAAAAQTTLGLGSAATANTGTSGATIPLLNGVNTWSGYQTFQNNILTIGTNPLIRWTDTDAGTYDAQWRLNSNNMYLEGSPDGVTYSTKIQFELDTNNVYFGKTGGGNTLIWNGTAVPVAAGGTGGTTQATARTGLGLGGLSTLDFSDLVYTGSSASNTNFPIGTVLCVVVSSLVARNASSPVYLHSSSSAYNSVPDGTQLSGTWRARGDVSANRQNFERTQ